MSKDGVKTKIDLSVLYERVERLHDDVKDIKSNHLVHIHGRIRKHEVRMAYYMGGLTLAGFLTQLVLSSIK